MSGEELERVAKFVQAINRAEFEFGVSLDLRGSYDSRYMRLRPGVSETRLEIEPYVGGSELELVRGAK